MNCRTKMIAIVLLGTSALAMGALMRPGGDPAPQRVIWADPFDWYNQWAWENSQTWCDYAGDPSGTPGPSGGLHNGPYPPGAVGGSLPTKAPNQGCDTMRQVDPTDHEMLRAMWVTTDLHKTYFGTGITTPGGMAVNTGDIAADVDKNCNGSGEIATTRGEYATIGYTWGTGGSYEAMTMYQHSFKDRIQYIDPSKNAVAGTDEHPLVLVFYITHKLYPTKDNFYVELSMDGDHAPTDYVWRGDATKNYPDPDGCPNGPFPIVCQQKRETNTSNSEDGGDLTWLNTACPALSTKTWKSLAFGMLAIMDKDPCGILEQGSDMHVPTVEHYAYFNGNTWRQVRNSREIGLETLPPPWDAALGGYDPGMQGGSGRCTNFSYPNDPDNAPTARVYIKIITNYVLVYVQTDKATTVDNGMVFERYWKDNPTDPNSRAGFNTISIGVGPGCELDPATGECKVGGTPKQALTYSRISGGYNRVDLDSMSIYDGELVYVNTTTGACCTSDGECSMVQQSACTAANGEFAGVGVSCAAAPRCCPVLYGDTDKDGDVDMADFAEFQRCLTTGPGSGGGANPIISGCECMDSENDGDVDGNDAIHFATCATGEGIAGDPNCKNW